MKNYAIGRNLLQKTNLNKAGMSVLCSCAVLLRLLGQEKLGLQLFFFFFKLQSCTHFESDSAKTNQLQLKMTELVLVTSKTRSIFPTTCGHTGGERVNKKEVTVHSCKSTTKKDNTHECELIFLLSYQCFRERETLLTAM